MHNKVSGEEEEEEEDASNQHTFKENAEVPCGTEGGQKTHNSLVAADNIITNGGVRLTEVPPFLVDTGSPFAWLYTPHVNHINPPPKIGG